MKVFSTVVALNDAVSRYCECKYVASDYFQMQPSSARLFNPRNQLSVSDPKG